jgi:large subunit ribosomal protein L13
MKTYSAKPADVTRTWYLIDASDAPLGRVATKAASLLLGKGKPTVTPHIDGGDYVIIINTDHLKVTGNKLEGKTYYHHTHYPGGIKQASLTEKMAKDSTQVLFKAVRGMLPVNKLRDGRLQRLKIYSGTEQPHDPQKPQVISLKGDK